MEKAKAAVGAVAAAAEAQRRSTEEALREDAKNVAVTVEPDAFGDVINNIPIQPGDGQGE